MKLSIENIKRNVEYIVTKGSLKFPKESVREEYQIKKGDTFNISYESIDILNKDVGDTYKLFRSLRKGESHYLYLEFKSIDKLLKYLSLFEVELDYSYAMKQIDGLRLKIDKIIFNYKLDMKYINSTFHSGDCENNWLLNKIPEGYKYKIESGDA